MELLLNKFFDLFAIKRKTIITESHTYL